MPDNPTVPVGTGWRRILGTLMGADIRRDYARKRREMEIRHAKERATLTAWRIEVEHLLSHGTEACRD